MKSDQRVVEVATYTAHSIHKRKTSLASSGFEPTILVIVVAQIYVLNRMATGNGKYKANFIHS